MTSNQRIIINLENLFNDSYNEIQDLTIGKWLDSLKVLDLTQYDFEESLLVEINNESTFKNFGHLEKDPKLEQYFKKAIEMDFNDSEIINSLARDLKLSFEKIKKEIKNVEDAKLQIIFIAHDYEPYAWLNGFGEGNYPILKKPKSFDFNYKKDFFQILGRLDYSNIWEDWIKLDEYLEEIELLDDVYDSEFCENLRECYTYKTYLYLNEVFNQNEMELFNDLDIKKPFFVYGHQHGCDSINIYSNG